MGNFVVVWRSEGSFGNDQDRFSIQGQRFRANGQKNGPQFQVNTVTVESQLAPRVAKDSDGDFVVAWESKGSLGSDTSGTSIQAQRFAADGEPIGTEFQVNSFTLDNQFRPSIAATPHGDFVVAWDSAGSSGDDDDGRSIQSQVYRVAAEVSGRAFVDSDFDGRRDASEAAFPLVPVHLRTDLGDLVASTVTNEAGEYSFRPKVALDGVSDRFYVDFDSPISVLRFTRQDVGSDDTIDSDGDVVRGETVTFVVESPAERFAHLDIGLITGPANVIGDRVWLDANGDGLLQVDEAGVAGVTVRLLDDAGAVVETTTTDAQGLYSFAPASGTYSIEVLRPADMFFTRQGEGTDDPMDSDVDPATGRTEPFAFSAGMRSRDHDAGLRTSLVFADGFESGDTSAWSTTVGTNPN